MDVLVLASQKGGAGKTTLSRHLAVEAERAGEGPVVLIDADPQGGLGRVVESADLGSAGVLRQPSGRPAEAYRASPGRWLQAGHHRYAAPGDHPHQGGRRLGRPCPHSDAAITRRPRCRRADDRHRRRGSEAHGVRHQRCNEERPDHWPGSDCSVSERHRRNGDDPSFGVIPHIRHRRANRQRTRSRE